MGIKPYYRDASVELYCGDLRELALLFDDGFFAGIIADPPYGVTSLKWDRWIPGWLAAVRPKLALSGSLWCFGSMRMLLDHAEEFRPDPLAGGWRYAQDVVWKKHNGSNFHNDRFRRVHEHALQFYRDDAAWEAVYKSPVRTLDMTPKTVRRKARPPHMGENAESVYVSEDGGPRLQRSVLEVRSCHGYAQHPTQKPLGILEPLLQYSIPEGGVVLDPVCGVGSVLLAAKRLGRKAVGFEVQENYCELAARMLAAGSDRL